MTIKMILTVIDIKLAMVQKAGMNLKRQPLGFGSDEERGIEQAERWLASGCRRIRAVSQAAAWSGSDCLHIS